MSRAPAVLTSGPAQDLHPHSWTLIMRTREIQTGPGKKRTVYIVSGKERRAYVRLARKLAKFERELATRQGVADVAHGFVAGRSPVTMATAHIGYDVTVSLDLSNWFESVHLMQLVEAGISPDHAAKCCVGDVVRQGLPTSPAAANIAGVALDALIVGTIRSWGAHPICYTRYADDLTISWRPVHLLYAPDMPKIVAALVAQMGWQLNERKTSIQYASAGRRIICGLSVGETDVRATRAVRHRLRACQHARPGTPQTRGLAEWAACKLPGHRLSVPQFTRTITREE